MIAVPNKLYIVARSGPRYSAIHPFGVQLNSISCSFIVPFPLRPLLSYRLTPRPPLPVCLSVNQALLLQDDSGLPSFSLYDKILQ